MNRSKSKLALAIIMAGALLATAEGVHASIVVPTYDASVSSPNTDTSLFDPTNLVTSVDGGGNHSLTPDVTNGVSLATAQSATFNGGQFSLEWETVGSGGGSYYSSFNPPVLVWDLGAQVNIANIILWQSDLTGNGNQLNGFTLNFGSTDTSFSGPLSNNLLADTNVAQSFALGGVSARYVQMILTSNQIDNESVGGDRVGFGQIRFNVADSVATPEPSSIVLGAIAVAFTIGFARRRRIGSV